MTDKNQALINRGIQADALLRSEVLLDAFNSLETKYLATWKMTTGDEAAAREKLWLAIKVIEDVHNHLKRAVQNGIIAQGDVNRMAGLNRAA